MNESVKLGHTQPLVNQSQYDINQAHFIVNQAQHVVNLVYYSINLAQCTCYDKLSHITRTM